MGKFAPTIAPATDNQLPRRRRKGSSDTPSANALRERVRAQNMKRAYLKLQKTLPQVPPDTKLPRLNILLLAIDYISHLRGVLHNETLTPERNCSPRNVEEKCGMFRPFIEVRVLEMSPSSKFNSVQYFLWSIVHLNCQYLSSLWVSVQLAKELFKEIISLTILKWSAKLQSQQTCLYCSTSRGFV